MDAIHLTELLGYSAILLVGLVLGLIGGGGAILTVPILVYVFRVPATQATGYSLFLVGVTSLVGSLVQWRRGMVALPVAFRFGFPATIATLLTRRLLVPALPASIFLMGHEVPRDRLTMIIFSLLMLAAATGMMRMGRATSDKCQVRADCGRLSWIIGSGVGVLAGIFGVGGGFLIIPSLSFICGIPIRLAVGTSLTIVAAQSLVGFVGAATGAVEWPLLLALTGLSLAGTTVGLILSTKLRPDQLKVGFSWFVLAVGLGILGHELLR